MNNTTAKDLGHIFVCLLVIAFSAALVVGSMFTVAMCFGFEFNLKYAIATWTLMFIGKLIAPNKKE